MKTSKQFIFACYGCDSEWLGDATNRCHECGSDRLVRIAYSKKTDGPVRGAHWFKYDFISPETTDKAWIKEED